MTSILQWGHIVLGQGGVSSRLRVFLFWLPWRLPTQRESCSLALMRLVTEAENLSLVVVRDALDFTNYHRKIFSMVAAAARASKYLLRSVSDLFWTFAWFSWSGFGYCLSVTSAAQNWSWTPTACFLTLAFRSAALYIFFRPEFVFFHGQVLPDFFR